MALESWAQGKGTDRVTCLLPRLKLLLLMFLQSQGLTPQRWEKNLFTFPKKDEAEGTFYIMFCILAEPGETS